MPKGLVTGAGLRLLGFRLVWFLALAGALLAMAGGAYQGEQDYRQITAPFGELGLHLAPGATAAVLDAPYSSEGGLAGIGRGDRVVAVAGQPSAAGWGSQRAVAGQLRAAVGPWVTIRTQSPGGVLADHRLGRAPQRLQRGLGVTGVTLHDLAIAAIIGNLAAQMLEVIAAALLFMLRTRERLPALFSLSLLLMVGGSASLWIRQVLPAAAPLVSAMLPLGWGGLLVSMLIFPTGRLEPRWTRWVPPLIALWTLAGWLLDSGAVAYPQVLLDLSGVVLFTIGVVAQVQRYRPLPQGSQRQQIRWAMFGFGSAGLVFVADLMLIAWRMQFASQDVGVWLGLFHPVSAVVGYGLLLGGLVISLLRYRLYDADMVISRSVGYALMTLALAAIWAGAGQAIQVLLEDRFGQAKALSAGLAAAVAALLITPVHQRAMRWAERQFQHALTDLRQRLPVTVGDLRETASIRQILDTALERIHLGVRADQGAVLLRDGKGWRAAAVLGAPEAAVAAWLDAHMGAAPERVSRGDTLFPLRLPLDVRDAGPPETIGWLLLGPRPDGSFFQRDELEALRELADPIARAIQIALTRTARERSLAAELRSLKAEIKAIGALVAADRTAMRPSP